MQVDSAGTSRAGDTREVAEFAAGPPSIAPSAGQGTSVSVVVLSVGSGSAVAELTSAVLTTGRTALSNCDTMTMVTELPLATVSRRMSTLEPLQVVIVTELGREAERRRSRARESTGPATAVDSPVGRVSTTVIVPLVAAVPVSVVPVSFRNRSCPARSSVTPAGTSEFLPASIAGEPPMIRRPSSLVPIVSSAPSGSAVLAKRGSPATSPVHVPEMTLVLSVSGPAGSTALTAPWQEAVWPASHLSGLTCTWNGLWWAMQGSNLRPSVCKTDALPTELIAHF